MDTRTIAIVGIDGSGKTTVIRRMLERLPSRWDVVGLINCPDYHEIPNAPLAQLSRDLDAFSQIADGLGDFQLKGVALYLQMTLYGPLSRFVVDTFHPRLLLSARHAVFDSLAYGSLYANIMKKPLDRARHEAALRELLPHIAFATPGDALDVARTLQDFAIAEANGWQLWRKDSAQSWIHSSDASRLAQAQALGAVLTRP